MGRYQVIAEDIRAMEEKLQSLKGLIPEEKYEEISGRIEDVKRLGVDLPDNFDDSKVQELIEQVVDLQFDNFSDDFVRESAKDIKRIAFLQRLQYIQNYIEKNEDSSRLIQEAEEYWKTMEGVYDDFEKSKVQRKLDEVKLRLTLSKIRSANTVDITSIDLNQNPYLIRENLQHLTESAEITQDDKLLVNSWLGECVDVKSGEIDRTALEKLLRTPKLWGLLAGVTVNELQPVKKTERQMVKPAEKKHVKRVGEESEERKQEIRAVCKKYGIPELIVRVLLKFGNDVCIVKGKIVYKAVAKPIECDVRQYFHGYEDCVRAVIFNNDVKKIHYQGAKGLNRLEDVVLSESMDVIGNSAFENCNLTEIRLPGKLRIVEDCAFLECRNLKKVKLSESLTKIGDAAFQNTAIETVVIPDNVTHIGNDAFYNCPMKNVDLGENISTIGERAFCGGKLKSVDIPPSVTEVKVAAFRFNPLKKVVLHNGNLARLGERVFWDTQIATLDVPEGVNGISRSVNEGVEIRVLNGGPSKSQKQEMSLDELKKQKQELEALLARINDRLITHEQSKENVLQK